MYFDVIYLSIFVVVSMFCYCFLFDCMYDIVGYTCSTSFICLILICNKMHTLCFIYAVDVFCVCEYLVRVVV